ncbi:1-acyl-sn-glycerol-3-phosphate acyltransferase [Pseudorhodobacter sp.]|uniref:1-acyl-sn-glycerol-3-phosphate acyltransferase n=1 Tax=Pseudorhodobacter sp. TaxID=1934400 RepID=UPI002647FF2F|nr:1-acyl-sn-glycerol-3-phosphate acyltransferase [Pseudorhodobacter sp.]MDN5786970.1 1-acyl-sn-glycerol-3-phosphate acyltransferase [Pseudorhodobacter sp.]
MTGTVTIPIWFLVLILLFGTVTFASHFLFPSVRWFFRARAQRALARLNQRLQRPIDPMKLMRRQDKIVRLIYDPAVMQAIAENAAETGRPQNVVFEEAKAYAREIVPGFSTLLYFGVATRLARWMSTLFYRVRIARVDAELKGIDPEATVIFVINHRSNMDYVLVTWLVADRSALSYAVGEWARVWPLGQMIRAMGAYFIRRNSRNALYRRVLARYVQMATAEGTTQAVFPEGGLSLDGRVGSARMGLLSYIVAGFDPLGRDVVFVPVGLSYDRVFEDGVLTQAAAEGTRRFRARPVAALRALLRTAWRKSTGRFTGFGIASAGFGAPLSLRDWLARNPQRDLETLGADLMARIAASVPVLPVPLAAAAIMQGPATDEELVQRMEGLAKRLRQNGVALRLNNSGGFEGIDALRGRNLVNDNAGVTQIAPGAGSLIAYYAASVQQALGE